MILLTGASGFIGGAFLRQAIEKQWRLRVLSRKSEDALIQDGIEVVKGDLANTIDWAKAVQGVEVVVHAAAEIEQSELMHVVNVLGPKRLLEAAINAGVKRWVQLSSTGSYGPILSGLVSEDFPDNPSNSYEVSKTNFDEILKQAGKAHGIEICIVRPSNVYGPGMRNQSIQRMLDAIQKNLFVFIGSEGASANYVHVKDVVQALDLCVSHPRAANQTYIVSAWETLEEMVSGLAMGAGITSPSRRVPLGFATFIAKAMKCWPSWPLTPNRIQAMSLRSRYSTKKIESELGWRLTVPVKRGMQEFSRDLL